MDLLTGNEKFFSWSHIGEQINAIKANELVDNFFQSLDKMETGKFLISNQIS